MIFNVTSGGGKKQLVTELITSSGDWTVPKGVKKVLVRLFGGGGGTGQSWYGSAGSGHMAYGEFEVAPGDTYSITIGAGATAGYNAGGTTSFGSFLSATGGSPPSTTSAQDQRAGYGGAGGGGAFQGTSYPRAGGNGSYGGGGGCGEMMNGGGNGGNGGTYGGGGGGIYVSAYSSFTGSGGTGGTYGGNGGYKTTAAQNGTDTTDLDVEFAGTGTAGSNANYSTGKYAGGGGGGYGGNGGNGIANYYYQASGGGGGYGGDGGDGGAQGDTSSGYDSYGGGGGGYGGHGGYFVTGSSYRYYPATGYGAGGGYGGGGGYGKLTLLGGLTTNRYGNQSCAGAPGICIIQYYA